MRTMARAIAILLLVYTKDHIDYPEVGTNDTNGGVMCHWKDRD